jgi:hypothetical protein
MDDQMPNSYCSEANRRLSELRFLVWLTQRKKEKRRLVIATLEALVGSSSAAKNSTGMINCKKRPRHETPRVDWED